MMIVRLSLALFSLCCWILVGSVANAQMITQPPVSTTAAPGTNATFSCRGTGSVLWQINGTQVRHASQLPIFESMLVYVPLPSDGFSELIVTATNTSLVIICVVDSGIGMGDVVKSDAVQLLVNDSRKRQSELGGTVTVPWTQNQVIITGLQSGAEYDVTVRTSTAAGISAAVGPRNRVSTTTPPPQIAAPSDTGIRSSALSADSTVAIIGGLVGIVIVLLIAVTTAIIVIIVLVLRIRKSQFSPNQKPLPYEAPGNVMLSDLSPTTNKEREIYENIEADHEYEILDKYNQATATYEDVKIPPPAKPQPTEAEAVQLQPMASTGDYVFTQCPAYVPVTTTSIHGNTTKPAAQNDQKDTDECD